MIKNTLLQPHEIKDHIGIMKSFPDCELAQIRKVELLVFRECLGKAFYDFLKENLCHYDCNEYCERNEDGSIKVYQPGDTVVYDGVIYIALVETSNIPATITDWKLAPKFKKDCLNDLWCDYLCEYLAWEVFKNRAPYLGVKIGPDGYVKSQGQGFSQASTEDLKFLQYTIDRDVCMSFDNLEDYLLDNKDNDCFNLFKGIAIGCCGDCGCKEEKCRCEKSCGDAKRTKHKRRVG